MIGQMILLGFSGDTPAAAAGMASLLERGAIGGVIYFRSNVYSLGDVRGINEVLWAGARNLPPLIAIDQEGGWVQRLTKDVGFPELPSAQQVAATRSPAEAEADYYQVAKQLASLGFNLNFGPVVDVNLNPENPVIGRIGRSYSEDPNKVITYAEAFIKAHRKAGMLTSLKHFPGHGSSAGDTHDGFVDITRSWNGDVELLPYQRLMQAGLVDSVMVGHLYNAGGPRQDLTAKYPASLSQGWIESVLRGRNGLGYQGVVITDDMNMGAITKEFGTDTAIVRAVRAGVDILLFSDPGDDPAGFARHIADLLVAESHAHPEIGINIQLSYGRIERLKSGISSLPAAPAIELPAIPYPSPARPFP